MKIWKQNNIYNFASEFNRIESYLEWCVKWLKYTTNIEVSIEIKTNWEYNDIVDLQDYNRVKGNINTLLSKIVTSQSNFNMASLPISNEINQAFSHVRANEIEERLYAIIDYLSELQWRWNITGLTIAGNDMKLGGVN